MNDDGLFEAPDARQACELSDARVAEELLAVQTHALGGVVRCFGPRVIDHPDARARRLSLASATRRGALEGPGADPGRLPRVLGQVTVGVDGAGAHPEHAHEDAERLGVGHPLAPLADGAPAKQLGDGAKRALGRGPADPAGLVVHGPGIDARTLEELTDGLFALVRAETQEVRLEDSRAKLLFAPLPDRALRVGRQGRGHRVLQRTLQVVGLGSRRGVRLRQAAARSAVERYP